MTRNTRNTVAVAGLLALAACVCLAVGLHLLGTAGAESPGGSEPAAIALVSRLAMVGGFMIFLLGTIALLAARRLAFGAHSLFPPRPAPDLELVDVRAWGRELEEIRDDLRRGPAAAEDTTEVLQHELIVPGTWQPIGEYVLRTDGRQTDPLADLKRTRDQLLTAAERVDAIVNNINEIESICGRRTAPRQGNGWLRMWRRWRRR